MLNIKTAGSAVSQKTKRLEGKLHDGVNGAHREAVKSTVWVIKPRAVFG